MNKKQISEAARALGRRGGLARAKSLSPEEMREQNTRASHARVPKPPRCPCLCGLTLHQGMTQHPARVLASRESKPERSDAMKAMRRDGQTLEAIGESFAVTRERVRQIIADPTKCKKS